MVTWKQSRDTKLTLSRIEELNQRADLAIMGVATESAAVDFYNTEFHVRADPWTIKALCQHWIGEYERRTGLKRVIKGF